MPITERVARLRKQSLDARPSISPERAELLTEFYRQNQGKAWSTPVFRAEAFRYILSHKTICLNEGELIVGEKGHTPKAAPTYPELCCHSVQDLDILNSREKTSFSVDSDTRRIYEETIIPFWQGKTMRELIFQEMTDEWKAAYEAGIFTEFMEQRSPGHTVLDDKIYRKGMLEFKHDINKALEGLDFLNDPQAYDKQEELKAMAICADGLIRFGERHAEKARQLAAAGAGPTTQGRAGAHRAGLHPRAGARAARFLGGVAILLVCPPGSNHRAEPLGCLQPRQAGPAPVSLLQTGFGKRYIHPRAGRGAAALFLDQVQQPARAAQGRRHRG